MLDVIGVGAGIGTAFSWSISSLFHSQATRLIEVQTFMMIRQPLALFVLGIVCFLTGESFVFPLEPISMALISGLTGIVISDWCAYESIARIGIRSTLVCLSLNACFTGLLSLFFMGEVLGAQGLAGIVISTCGVIAVIMAEQRDVHARRVSKKERNVGIALALFAALTLSIGMITTKQALHLGMTTLPLAFWRNLVASLALWGVGIFLHHVHKACTALFEKPILIKYLLVGCLFGPAGGIWISCVALQRLPAGVAATLIGLQPVAILIVSGIWERRVPVKGSIIGACVACAGAALLLLR